MARPVSASISKQIARDLAKQREEEAQRENRQRRKLTDLERTAIHKASLIEAFRRKTQGESGC